MQLCDPEKNFVDASVVVVQGRYATQSKERQYIRGVVWMDHVKLHNFVYHVLSNYRPLGDHGELGQQHVYHYHVGRLDQHEC